MLSLADAEVRARHWLYRGWPRSEEAFTRAAGAKGITMLLQD